ncbi:MAG: transglycosylase SLT domain-containing protein, partial [Muribaculaceae bacterium]|nr:transglycosylase SLT domain-containing protein [Muribaculaceae bacterium]
MSLYYMPIFEQALEAEGMPNELKYVPVIESALNPFAKSRAKAVGLWQFMSPTARGLGLEINSLVDERRDPIRSSTMGARYLKQLYEIYKDWSLAIAAYNCGPGNVNKALRRCQSDRKDFWAIYNYLPAETRGYVPAFIAANYIMTYYNMHGISPSLAKRPLVTDTVHVSRRVHFKQIAEVLDIPEKEIRILNPQYLQDVIPGDIHPYALILPSHQVLSYVVSEDSILKFDAEKYGRRTEVEPGEEFNDGQGEYVNKLVVKYHNVRKGESLGKIANKYGCTINNLKKWNNLRNNNIRAGQRLKIQSYQRVRVPKKEDPELKAAVAEKASADSIAATKQTDSVQTVTTQPAKAAEQVKKPTTPKKPQKQYVTHKIKSGENLGAIARKYGVTVQQIKRANPNIKGTRINAGQRIKIPVK